MVDQNLNLKNQNYNSNVKSKDVKIRSYILSLEIIKFVNSLPNQRAFWVIGDQLLRSITSIGANMIEAHSSSSRKEYINYYQISLKSANEARYWLGLLRDSYPELQGQCEIFLQEVMEISNMIAASILTLKGKRKF
jgi:four helix bundle protein